MHSTIMEYKEYCLKILNSYTYVEIDNPKMFIEEEACETFLDLETTGLGIKGKDYILEIFAIKRALNGEIVGRFHTYIKDPLLREIPPEATAINKITMNTIQYAPSTFEVISSFKMFLQDDIVISHNSGFDWSRFLKREFADKGIYCNNLSLCTLQLSKMVFTGLNNHRLSTLAEFLDVKFNKFSLHGAKADVAIMIAIYESIKEPEYNDELKICKAEAYKKHYNVRMREYKSMISNYDFENFSLDKVDAMRGMAVINIGSNLYDLYFDKNKRHWDLSNLTSGTPTIVRGKPKTIVHTHNINIVLLNKMIIQGRAKGA